jgi:release factor glutamine methyltransferase
MAEPHRTGSQPLAILDVGTGSGCVAVLLKTKIPYARLYGCDISVGALAVARLNALQLHADVHFLQIDFLSRADRLRLPEVDLIVSNPPYIPEREKSSMALHVTAYEPSLALFVPNDDPLVFYQALGIFAQEKLTSGGCILVEVHSPLALRAKDLLVEQGFAEVEVRKDILGNDRFLKAVKR